jgi:thiamine biosynthesis protein ThiS
LTITLNGESFEIPTRLSVASLLARLEIDPRRVAVEHNQVVVRRAAFDDTVIDDGDSVEIVNFVGGGA